MRGDLVVILLILSSAARKVNVPRSILLGAKAESRLNYSNPHELTQVISWIYIFVPPSSPAGRDGFAIAVGVFLLNTFHG